MTNFEKWIRSITPEQVAKAFQHNRFPDACEICPAYKRCLAYENGFEDRTCGQEFLRWANEEVLGDGS